jgi:hypothetical protein
LDLTLPEEPTEIRERTRATLEASPKKGVRAINDSAFIAEYLWGEWGEDLELAGVEYDRFLTIARGNAGEARLWIVGERPWIHFADGLAGRVRRRAGATRASFDNENELAAVTGVCG